MRVIARSPTHGIEPRYHPLHRVHLALFHLGHSYRLARIITRIRYSLDGVHKGTGKHFVKGIVRLLGACGNDRSFCRQTALSIFHVSAKSLLSFALLWCTGHFALFCEDFTSMTVLYSTSHNTLLGLLPFVNSPVIHYSHHHEDLNIASSPPHLGTLHDMHSMPLGFTYSMFSVGQIASPLLSIDTNY